MFDVEIVSAEQMKAMDRRSVELGVSVHQLMEHAGAAVARFCVSRFDGIGLIVALCGKGNNGGDGMVAARELARGGRKVRIALLGAAAEVTGDAAQAMQSARSQAGVEFREIADEAALRDALSDAVLVLDAVVGTGFKPPLRGIAIAARDLLANSGHAVVAVDLPSGWDADASAQDAPRNDAGYSESFRADAVVTFARPKPAHVFGDLAPVVVVADIGTPKEALASGADLYWAGTAKSVAETPRTVNSNKGRFGHVLIVGGSLGKAGAPSMASLAAMRTGAGLTTAAIPREILPTVAGVAPELMCTPLEQASGAGGLDLQQLEETSLAELLKGITVVGMGPGLGQAGTTPEFVRGFVERVTIPLVLDADALNALAGRTELLKKAAGTHDAKGRPRTLVLTPHPGEMARLVGLSVKEVEADRVGLARRFATENGVTLVLKGWRTLIAHPGGRVAVNTTGNPAMAKGGSGDILTGIIAAMIAQYPEQVTEAVEAAVFLHGLAGDFAVLEQDEHTLLATDTVQHLAQAFQSGVEDGEGTLLLVGLAADARRFARDNQRASDRRERYR